MQSMIKLFNSLSAPYLLSEGSLLHLYRNCSVGNSDLDFSLEHSWWMENKEKLDNDLANAGFNRTAVFGNIDMFGYEEAWEKNDIKVDIFSSIMEENTHKIGFWVQGKLYTCSIPLQMVGLYNWRGSVTVRIPLPVEDAVIAMYGRNYEHPVEGWQWDLYPFLTGYCSYKNVE
jgi:hypothetical protein